MFVDVFFISCATVSIVAWSIHIVNHCGCRDGETSHRQSGSTTKQQLNQTLRRMVSYGSGNTTCGCDWGALDEIRCLRLKSGVSGPFPWILGLYFTVVTLYLTILSILSISVPSMFEPHNRLKVFAAAGWLAALLIEVLFTTIRRQTAKDLNERLTAKHSLERSFKIILPVWFLAGSVFGTIFLFPKTIPFIFIHLYKSKWFNVSLEYLIVCLCLIVYGAWNGFCSIQFYRWINASYKTTLQAINPELYRSEIRPVFTNSILTFTTGTCVSPVAGILYMSSLCGSESVRQAFKLSYPEFYQMISCLLAANVFINAALLFCCFGKNRQSFVNAWHAFHHWLAPEDEIDDEIIEIENEEVHIDRLHKELSVQFRSAPLNPSCTQSKTRPYRLRTEASRKRIPPVPRLSSPPHSMLENELVIIEERPSATPHVSFNPIDEVFRSPTHEEIPHLHSPTNFQPRFSNTHSDPPMSRSSATLSAIPKRRRSLTPSPRALLHTFKTSVTNSSRWSGKHSPLGDHDSDEEQNDREDEHSGRPTLSVGSLSMQIGNLVMTWPTDGLATPDGQPHTPTAITGGIEAELGSTMTGSVTLSDFDATISALQLMCYHGFTTRQSLATVRTLRAGAKTLHMSLNDVLALENGYGFGLGFDITKPSPHAQSCVV